MADILVRYVGPGNAILGETFIFNGEVRAVTEGQLDQARMNHPDHQDWFEEVILESSALPVPLPTEESPVLNVNPNVNPPVLFTAKETPTPKRK